MKKVKPRHFYAIFNKALYGLCGEIDPAGAASPRDRAGVVRSSLSSGFQLSPLLSACGHCFLVLELELVPRKRLAIGHSGPDGLPTFVSRS